MAHRIAALVALTLVWPLAAQDAKRQLDKDLKAIAELRKKDIAATKAYDVETLASLWTEDIIALPPNQPVLRGKADNRASLEAGKDFSKNFEVLDYRQEWEELVVTGDYAFEWGTFYSAVKSRQSGAVMRADNRVMRVLKRQGDGSWKVHRTIWNNLPTPPPPETPEKPKQ